VAEGIPLQEPFDADQALGFSLIDLGQGTWFIHFGGNFPGFISVLLAQPERGFGVVIMTNAWSGYELIWEILYSILYEYGFLPTTWQILNMGYSMLLFLAAFLVLPLRYVVRRVCTRKEEGEEAKHKRGRIATIAIMVVMLTIVAVLVLSVLYRGPLGGYMISDRAKGEPPLTKALLGLFFSMPVVLVVLTVLAWKDRYWSIPKLVQYTIIVLGTLVGIYLLRDLWDLMFWG